jgi:hypothetical protein
VIESTDRPASWRYVTLIKAHGKRFDLRLPISYSKFGKQSLKAAGLNPETPTCDVTMKNALVIGQKLEDWRAQQEKDPPKRK